MGNNKDVLKESASVIEEIEDRLEETISKKKEEIEKELEERLRQEKEEAKQRIEQIEKEFVEEKQALTNYRATIKEYENNKANLKNLLEEHLNKAVQFQKEIENITAQTLEELKNVSELNQKLEDLYKEAEEKAVVLKKTLKEKFGIAAEVLKASEYEEVELNLEQELAKLKKIKELLTSPDEELPELVEEKEAEEEEKEEKEEEEEKKEEEVGVPEGEAEKEKEQHEERAEEREGIEPSIPEEEETKEEEPLPEEEEPLAEEKDEEAELKGETAVQDVSETLEKHRKSETMDDNGEINYFQKNDKIILDGEGLISALSNSLDEAKKLYIKLSHAESPKDQFFIKQEIIRHQEALRKVILRGVRMCEKETCSLPGYTIDILNMDVLKDILEKLNMENWSNQNDFTYFETHVKNLKDNYFARITPLVHYQKSIMDELKIE